jgi:hypothetical protein
VNSISHFSGSRRFDTDDHSPDAFWRQAQKAREVLEAREARAATEAA